MHTQYLKKSLVIALLGFASTQAYAANTDAALATGNGSAATSTGTFDVNISKGDAVAITGLSGGGITIAGTNDAVDKTDSFDVCTYATTATYSLDIDSQGGAGAFLAVDGVNSMAYSVEWDDGTAANTTIFTSTADAAMVGVTDTISKVDPTCGGGTNTTITVTVASAIYNASPAGTYTDTLNVIIAAQ